MPGLSMTTFRSESRSIRPRLSIPHACGQELRQRVERGLLLGSRDTADYLANAVGASAAETISLAVLHRQARGADPLRIVGDCTGPRI